jgi:hypothetical protein
MSIFEQWNTEYAKQVEGGLKAKNTYERYKAVYKHVSDFLQFHYHVSDIALKEITVNFLSDFEIFLKTEKHVAHNTVETYVKPVMMLLHRAQENGWVARYPFGDYHIQREEVEKGFLTKDELQAVMNLPIKNAKTVLYPRPVCVLLLHRAGLYRLEKPQGREPCEKPC